MNQTDCQADFLDSKTVTQGNYTNWQDSHHTDNHYNQAECLDTSRQTVKKQTIYLDTKMSKPGSETHSLNTSMVSLGIQINSLDTQTNSLDIQTNGLDSHFYILERGNMFGCSSTNFDPNESDNCLQYSVAKHFV